MIVFVVPSYTKAYKRIIKKQPQLKSTIQIKIDLFIENPASPELKLHKLSGLRNNWSFSITDDLRITFSYTEGGVIFTDIGKHDDVY